jgi:diguanylate cyclase (GGDEF)-like protein
MAITFQSRQGKWEVLMWIVPAIITTMVSTFMLALLYMYHFVQNGEKYFAILALGWLTCAGIVGVIEIIRDITSRKEMKKQLQYLATHDSLTGIPNRYYLEELLQRAIEDAKRGKTSALLFIDMDNFKLVNDTYGHAAGDEVLVSLTNILNGELRRGDILARLGGDEFAVLLEDVTVEDATLIAEKLRSVVDASELYLAVQKYSFNLSISIGIVLVDGALDSQKLLSYADTALYSAKEGGKNKVVLLKPREEMTARLSEVNDIISLIKGALRDDKFLLYYQPVVNMDDGNISHHEALIRLRGDDGGLISPVTFIPIAERFGLMSQIDRWVVKTSIKALQKYPDLNLFINLSGVSLGDDTLLEYIETKIFESAVNPKRMGFEITETAAIKELARAEHWINRLKNLGCLFALDDFGIGFSSFSYLNSLPVDYLKIDGTYVRNVDTEPTNRALVQAMNTVAHALGKKTVAECVESINIIEVLHELGIDCGQGYFLGKPSAVPLKN